MSAETEHKADAIRSSLALLRQHLDWDRSLERLAELQNAVEDQDLWNDQQKAQAIMREKNSLEVMINDVNSITRQLDDAMEMVELAEAEGDEGLVAETLQQLIELELLATRKQLESLLSGEADNNDCFLEINAGAGGTEAQDWALMLLRMYSRWAEQHGYKIEYIEESPGEEAGIKSVTMRFNGERAYGWMKTESGVHRLVRISPYDSSARRHTSFASVWVYPVVDDANASSAAKTDIGWGNQIRSYVLHPYQMVKDLRTQVEKGNAQGVLDGDIDDFLEAGLAQRLGK